MFSPFIQYSIDSENPAKPTQTVQAQQETSGKGDAAPTEKNEGTLEIVAVVGCLEQSAAGTWRLTHSSDPVVNKTQATSMAELKEESVRPLGKQQYELLGASFFNPASHKGEKVAVKGVFIKDANHLGRINVTSQQTLASTCDYRP
jgi:hypothetical protein